MSRASRRATLAVRPMGEPHRIREYADGEIVAGTPYRVVQVIGAGGMGCVYEVEHVELGRRYVLKSLLASLSSREDLIARMRNEWRSLGRLSHENIVDVVNAGVARSGTPYYVMERLVGESLSARLRRRRRLPVEEAAAIACGILRGLAAAHAIGVVHRDVKPGNVFLTEDGGVKVLDFGIAKILDDPTARTTARGLAIGTPRYMSPEQAAGSAADPRADLYAVGLVLFEMIVGRGPFDDAREAAVQMLAHLSRPAPRLASLAPHVPAALDRIVGSALAKHPADRPPGAQAMADALAPMARAADLRAAFSEPPARDDSTEIDARPPWTELRGAEAAEPEAPSSIPVDVVLTPTEVLAPDAHEHPRDRTTRTQPHVGGTPDPSTPGPTPRRSTSLAPRPVASAGGAKPRAPRALAVPVAVAVVAALAWWARAPGADPAGRSSAATASSTATAIATAPAPAVAAPVASAAAAATAPTPAAATAPPPAATTAPPPAAATAPPPASAAPPPGPTSASSPRAAAPPSPPRPLPAPRRSPAQPSGGPLDPADQLPGSGL